MPETKITKELTPAHLRCVAGSCPAVYALSDGELLIIGKKVTGPLHDEIADRIGSDEFAVRLSQEFFSDIPGRKR